METAVLSECLVSKPISEAGAATEVGEEHEEHTRSLRYGPLSAIEYTSSFQIGDIPEAWRPLVAREAQAFRGSWQVLLHRSEPIDDLMKALGINMLKRRVMASYCSVTDVEVTKDNTTGPTLKIATHLPMNCLKQCIVSFDNSWAEQTDVDTGTWKTWSVWIDGRAMQRRQSDLGVMFDVRAIFPSDPVLNEKSGNDKADIPLMLFKVPEAYRPKEKATEDADARIMSALEEPAATAYYRYHCFCPSIHRRLKHYTGKRWCWRELRVRCSHDGRWPKLPSKSSHVRLPCLEPRPLLACKETDNPVVCAPSLGAATPPPHRARFVCCQGRNKHFPTAVFSPFKLQQWSSGFPTAADEVPPTSYGTHEYTVQEKRQLCRLRDPLLKARVAVCTASAYQNTVYTAANAELVPGASPVGKAFFSGGTGGNVNQGRGVNSESGAAGPEPSYVRISSGYHLLQCEEGFSTSFGGYMSKLDIAYETWGILNDEKSNAVLLTCGLSASSHAKSSPSNPQKGWWEDFIGAGLALDTDRFFVICVANLGSCYGTTGPSSYYQDSVTEKSNRYGLRFPMFSVQDMVRVMFRVVDHLGIEILHAVVGSSLGGMQSLAAAVMYPRRINRVVSISASVASSPLSIALRFVQRQALMADPAFKDGEYYESAYPVSGMKLAREIATITYRSGPEWSQRFGRRRVMRDSGSRGSTESNMKTSEKTETVLSPSLGTDFTVEAYLEHQGQKWCHVYDPNSMLLISKAMDLFSLAEVDPHTGEPSLSYGLRNVHMPVLIIGVESDILFPLWQQQQTARALREAGNRSVAFYTLDSIYGHDTFLIDVANVGGAVKGHLEQSYSRRV